MEPIGGNGAREGPSRVPVAALAGKSLPRFDVSTMSSYLEDRSLRDQMHEIYNHFVQHPDLIPPEGESLSKEEVGEQNRPVVSFA